MIIINLFFSTYICNGDSIQCNYLFLSRLFRRCTSLLIYRRYKALYDCNFYTSRSHKQKCMIFPIINIIIVSKSSRSCTFDLSTLLNRSDHLLLLPPSFSPSQKLFYPRYASLGPFNRRDSLRYRPLFSPFSLPPSLVLSPPTRDHQNP